MIGAVTTFTPRRPGLQSRLWREAARLFFKHVVNPTLPVEVRRRRLERMTRVNWLPSGTRVGPGLKPGEQGRLPWDCVSPWTAWPARGESIRTPRRYAPCFRPETFGLSARESWAAAEDQTSPRASPVYPALRELPPLLVQV